MADTTDQPEPITIEGAVLLVDADGAYTLCDEGDDREERASSAGLEQPWRVIPLTFLNVRPPASEAPVEIDVPDAAAPEPVTATAG